MGDDRISSTYSDKFFEPMRIFVKGLSYMFITHSFGSYEKQSCRGTKVCRFRHALRIVKGIYNSNGLIASSRQK